MYSIEPADATCEHSTFMERRASVLQTISEQLPVSWGSLYHRFFTPVMDAPAPSECAHGFSIMQFNMLADGLSGLRPDRGDFTRVPAGALDWNFRRFFLNKIFSKKI